jgi:hypothetical protein
VRWPLYRARGGDGRDEFCNGLTIYISTICIKPVVFHSPIHEKLRGILTEMVKWKVNGLNNKNEVHIQLFANNLQAKEAGRPKPRNLKNNFWSRTEECFTGNVGMSWNRPIGRISIGKVCCGAPPASGRMGVSPNQPFAVLEASGGVGFEMAEEGRDGE